MSPSSEDAADADDNDDDFEPEGGHKRARKQPARSKRNSRHFGIVVELAGATKTLTLSKSLLLGCMRKNMTQSSALTRTKLTF